MVPKVRRVAFEARNELRHVPGEPMVVRNRLGQFLLHLLQARFATVKTAVDSGVEVATDDPAASDKQHAVESHLAVERSEMEIAVVQDQQRTKQSENHVHAKPDTRRTESVQETDAFAQGIEQQQQHQRAARDAEPVADTLLRIDQIVVANQPAERDQQREQQIPLERTGISAHDFFLRLCRSLRRGERDA